MILTQLPDQLESPTPFWPARNLDDDRFPLLVTQTPMRFKSNSCPFPSHLSRGFHRGYMGAASCGHHHRHSNKRSKRRKKTRRLNCRKFTFNKHASDKQHRPPESTVAKDNENRRWQLGFYRWEGPLVGLITLSLRWQQINYRKSVASVGR